MFVYASFSEERDAADAVRSLMRSGFDARYISALMRTGTQLSELPISVETGVERGVVLGAAIGAAGGALLATGPGILAAGPILAALEGALAGGALGSVHGGILGLLFGHTKIGFGQEDLDSGTILVGVNADTREELARRLLAENHAVRVASDPEPPGSRREPRAG